jgi:hypothetical protein
MKVTELLESKFSVEHKHGRFKRTHDMTLGAINDSIMFTHAEKKQIAKLAVGSTLTTQATGIQGRTIIHITRTS